MKPRREHEQSQVEQLEVIDDLGHLGLDAFGALLWTGMERVWAGALDERHQHRHRGGGPIAGQRREEHAEPVGVQLDGLVRADHLVTVVAPLGRRQAWRWKCASAPE